MNRVILLLMLVLCLSACTKSQTVVVSDHSGTITTSLHAWVPSLIIYEVAPSTTDSRIKSFDNRHYTSVLYGMDTMRTLYVLLPGSYRSPAEYKEKIHTASQLGYHAIGLSYVNNAPVNPMCRPTADTSCHRRARMENIDGIDRHLSIYVDSVNCVLSRLKKVLQHLSIQYPKSGWGQYCVNGQLRTTRIILDGHSQGASLAAIMGQMMPFKRVIMHSVMDYLDIGAYPSWVEKAVNTQNYYAVLHYQDELVPYAEAKKGWAKMGLYNSGHAVWIDRDQQKPPYNNSHILIISHQPKPGTDPYHNGTAVDAYLRRDSFGTPVLKQTWQYLLKP